MPSSRNRASSSEWSGSSIVIESGSPNAVDASSKLSPCFSSLPAAFSSDVLAKMAGVDRPGGDAPSRRRHAS
jgi:hypothetical protein